MYSLLPQENIEKLISEYRARLSVVIAWMIGGSVIVSAVLLLPSYIYIYATNKEVSSEVAALKKRTEEAGAQKLESELTSSNVVVKEFATFEHQIPLSELVKRLGSRIVPGITIKSFSIVPEKSADETLKGVEQTYSVQLVGEAATRDALVGLTESLTNEITYSAVGLPISNLARSSKIPFSLSFKAIAPKIQLP